MSPRTRPPADPHPDRRGFLRVGAVGGLALPGLLRAAHAPTTPAPGFGRARRCVLLFLTGGPPQHDTFDPKPDAPAEVRGELKPIATRAVGLRFSELCPRLAGVADRLCVVRSVTHRDNLHTTAGYAMLTGVAHPQANAPDIATVRPTVNDHPHLGALLALARPPAGGLPAFAALPEVIKDAGVNEFLGQGPGFLGPKYGPFRIEADRGEFLPPPVEPPADVPADRLDRRAALLARLDAGAPQPDRDIYYQQAFDLIRAPAVRCALRADVEPARVREAYGAHLFGRGCLSARRLLEAGIPLVTVYWHYEGPDDSPVWDTHENNFKHLRERLVPPADRAIAALVEDLGARGLLGDTLVVVMGEFGRSPRINRQGGREHWAPVQSVLLAGAGVPGGTAYGASDRTGGYPADRPVSPADLTATVLHRLGVPAGLEVRDRTGRPLRACEGTPILVG
ncbi:MAG TPA: DUF1501 domain-containing protein [Urbifossiella sp.]|nr:DUF1501 domain-containing protein [Urbifossiella sp.]